MQRNKKRKGFTLTELAIVIAVIAILIAVLVPTFTSLINKANESADEQAVKSMNTALAADEAINGKKTNPSEAMQVLKDAGYNVENYQALDSNNVIYWNSETNRTLLYSTSENAVIYPSDAASAYTNLVASNLPNYWYTLSEAYSTTKFETTATTTAEVTTAFVNALKDLDEGETLQLTSNVTLDAYNSFTDSEGVEYKSYTCVKDKTTYTTGLITSEYKTKLEAAGYSSFTEYETYSSLTVLDGSNVEIDLNGYTLSDEGQVSVENGSSLTIRNGTYVETTRSSGNCNIYVDEGCSAMLDGVEMNVTGSGIFPCGDSAQVNVINSTITSTGNYCIGTNAGSLDNYGVIITLSNSTFTTNNEYDDACAVFINVAGTLNIDNCVINGQRQGVIVRAGTANITNTTINCSMSSSNIATYDISGKYYDGKLLTRATYSDNWSSGNEVAMGAVVVGNNNNYNSTKNTSAYCADAIVTMSGCNISYEIDGSSYDQYEIALFMVANNLGADGTTKYNTSVTVSDCSFSGKVIKFDISSTKSVDVNSNNGCACTLTGYTSTYTKWNGTAWE